LKNKKRKEKIPSRGMKDFLSVKTLRKSNSNKKRKEKKKTLLKITNKMGVKGQSPLWGVGQRPTL